MTQEDVLIRREIQRLNARAWGWALGLLFGLGLFLATIVLVVKGGPQMGRHLSLLSVYFPGYKVSVLGSFIGFVYMFVIGYGVGRVIGTLYNWLVDMPADRAARVPRA